MVDTVETVEWMCGVCRYVYISQAGDPRGNLPPGTCFEDLPEDWVCPACKAPKSKFFDV